MRFIQFDFPTKQIPVCLCRQRHLGHYRCQCSHKATAPAHRFAFRYARARTDDHLLHDCAHGYDDKPGHLRESGPL